MTGPFRTICWVCNGSGLRKEFPDSAIGMVEAERRRQVDREGWSAEHDDGLSNNTLARAAACYAMPPGVRDKSFSLHYTMTPHDVVWPFDPDFWKPAEDDRVRELVKAAALIVAEIERMQRIQSRAISQASEGIL